MKPLFFVDNNGQREEIDSDGDGRKKYRLQPGCRHVKVKRESSSPTRTVDGDQYEIMSDGGNTMLVWASNRPDIAEEDKYYCHGHSFRTYEDFGYTVAEIGGAIMEEWEYVGSHLIVSRGSLYNSIGLDSEHYAQIRDAQASHNLIAVGIAQLPSPHIIHSFRITSVRPEYFFLESGASSKNTFRHFISDTSIRSQLREYEDIWALRFMKEKRRR